MFLKKICYNTNMKTAVITGASGGIGSEIAITLAKQGYNLALIYNKHRSEINKLSKKLGATRILVFQCDLSDEKQVNNTFKSILKEFKTIDCLINTAGVSQFKQIQDVTNKDFEFIFNNNLKSTVFSIKNASKAMISQKYGRIINISSIWGNVGASVESLYSASKGAINSLTLALAKELAPSNITVNAIAPGLIDTKMNKSLSEDTIKEIVDYTPLGRIGTPQDIAEMVAFLCDDKASFITGQIITIDGGLTL